MATNKMIGRTGGSIAPAEMADYLKKHGHLELTYVSDMTTQYYTWNDSGYMVKKINGTVVQVEKVDIKEVKSLATYEKNKYLKFGDF